LHTLNPYPNFQLLYLFFSWSSPTFFLGASKEPELKTTPAVKVWNLYSYNLHKATYHGLNHLKGRENTRNFILGRGCYSGMHRFAALWTGDNVSTWDFLKINVAQVGWCILG
jgi:alpha-glucosidase (family GH31 glycosyl hydrolase)